MSTTLPEIQINPLLKCKHNFFKTSFSTSNLSELNELYPILRSLVMPILSEDEFKINRTFTVFACNDNKGIKFLTDLVIIISWNDLY